MTDTNMVMTGGANVPNAPAIRLRGVAKPQGHCHGFAQRCTRASFEIASVAALADVARRLPAVLEAELRAPQGISGTGQGEGEPVVVLVTAVVAAVERLQEIAGIPNAGNAKLVSVERMRNAEGQDVLGVVLAIPSFKPDSTSAALIFALDLANAMLAESWNGFSPALKKHLYAMLESLRADAPHCDNNTRHLIRAALSRGVPLTFLLSGLLQFGWGKRSRLFWSLATDATSMIGARISGNKLSTAALMRAVSIPVPVHEAVTDANSALVAARRIGFPVVVKPTDSEKGQGATADLRNEAEVTRAYEKARQISPNVMVEKHVDGNEYRLLVVNGRLFWAFHRVPALVRGDGVSTIEQLIENLNRTRRDAPNDGFGLRKIVVDPDLLERLERQGLALGSVPKDGALVRLRGVPRVADGGEVIPVFDRVHPDNAAIAERAAQVMRLDIAGIDLLIPDISRSWREVGGRITEVNSVPQLSPLSRSDIYAALLDALVEGNGRVPVALVVGDDSGLIVDAVRERLAQAGLVGGVASDSVVMVGREEISHGPMEPFAAARTLTSHPSVEAIVLAAGITELLQQGLPIDRVDLLVIADSQMEASKLRALLAFARPHLAGEVLVMEDDETGGIVSRTMDQSSVILARSQDDLIDRLSYKLIS